MQPLHNSIVRIRSSEKGREGAIVGSGFLVDEKHVLTCAHVVAVALGIPATTADTPKNVISLDFPLLPDNSSLKAHVVRWAPMRDEKPKSSEIIEDIAVLELEVDAPPVGAKPVQLQLVK